MATARLHQPGPEIDLAKVNDELASVDAEGIVRWAHEQFGSGLVMSTSFGIQSAVMLHLVTQVIPDLPVIWIDTGYLHRETYRFAQELTDRLQLNLRVFQSPLSPARMEAVHGRLWEKDDVESLNQYDLIRKVEPMRRALSELGATAWLAGLRSDQTDHRKTLQAVQLQDDRYKVLPILRWHRRDVHRYLQEHSLPYHPLFDAGYSTVGDWHSSRPVTAEDGHERETRFGGRKQECGLHLPSDPGVKESFDSSGL